MEEQKTSGTVVRQSALADGEATERRGRGRPKQISDELQRDAIVEAAWRLFLDRGYGKTMMSDLAAEAHVSLGTIYRLYSGKPDLFGAVVALHRRSMLALPGDYDDLPLAEALERIFQLDLSPEAERQRDALMRVFLLESRQFPELAEKLHEHGPEHSRRLLANWLERRSRRSALQFDDAESTARMLMDVVFGAINFKGPDLPHWPGMPDRLTYLRSCFRILARGLEPD